MSEDGHGVLARRSDSCRVCDGPIPIKRRHYCSERCRKVSKNSDIRQSRAGTRTSRQFVGRLLGRTLRESGPLGALEVARKYSEVTADGCWLWSGNMNMRGYATLTMDGRSQYLHRLTWQWANGRESEQTIHHACASSSCINPNHLLEATHRDNIAEMFSRRAYELEIDRLKWRIEVLEAQLRERGTA